MPPRSVQDAGGIHHQQDIPKTPVAAQYGEPENISLPGVEDAVLNAVATMDDSDIQILYEILQVADSDPKCRRHPYQAIFPAHEAVLPLHGLDGTGSEARFLRFLYRLPPLRKEGQELVEVFEQVLVRHGITIEEASNNDAGSKSGSSKKGGIEPRRRSPASRVGRERQEHELLDARIVETQLERRNVGRFEEQRRAGRGSMVVNEDDTDLRQHTRRFSFGEFLAEERKAQAKTRVASRTSVSRLQDHSQGFGATMPKPKSTVELAKPKVDPEEVGSRNTRAKAQPEYRKMARSRSDRQGSKRSQQRETAERTTQPQPHAPEPDAGLNRETLRRLELWAESVQTQDFNTQPAAPQNLGSIYDEGYGGGHEPRQGDQQAIELPRPSLAQLERDADTFYYFRIQDIARTLLQQWRSATRTQQTWQQSAHETAIDLDQEALLRQGFERWKLASNLKRHLRRAEDRYRGLEERATRARSFRLLAKAFTHWAEYGAEERQRTEAARRHVLRLKYFHAWQEITVMNKLKVRRFVLAKVLFKWKQAFVKTWIQDNRALALYRGNLVQDAYWAWFWRFCAERAPQWRDGLLRRRYFSRLTDAVQKKQEVKKEAVAVRRRNLLLKSLKLWRAQSVEAKQKAAAASTFQRSQTISRALPQWRLQLRLAPAARRTEGMVDHRVASQALGAWSSKATMSLQATRIDIWRVVHNAWTSWNDQLRIRIFQRQRDERLLTSALYKWVLAERSAHFQCASEAQTSARMLAGALERWKGTQARLQEAHDQVVASRKRKLLQTVLGKWKERHQETQAQSQQADAFDFPRTTHLVLEQWCTSYNCNLSLSGQSESAQRYFRLNRSLQKWHSAAATSRKRKLQAAYVAVRVKHKKKQARQIVQKWWSRTSSVVAMVDDAETILHGRLWALARSAFMTWRQALQAAQGADQTAVHQRNQNLLQLALQPWANRTVWIEEQSAQANAFARLGSEREAALCLRRLQLRLLEVKSLDARIGILRSWTDNHRQRALLRLWAERTKGTGNLSESNDDMEAAARSSSVKPMLFSATSMDPAVSDPRQDKQAEPESSILMRALDPQRQEHQPGIATQLSPLPGYLSTPSRRAARAKALVSGNPSFTPQTEPRTMLLRSVLGNRQRAGTVREKQASRDVGADMRESTTTGPRPSFGRRTIGDFGRVSVTGAGSSLPVRARTQLETPLGRSLFQRRPDIEGEETDFGRSIHEESVEEGV